MGEAEVVQVEGEGLGQQVVRGGGRVEWLLFRTCEGEGPRMRGGRERISTTATRLPFKADLVLVGPCEKIIKEEARERERERDRERGYRYGREDVNNGNSTPSRADPNGLPVHNFLLFGFVVIYHDAQNLLLSVIQRLVCTSKPVHYRSSPQLLAKPHPHVSPGF